MSRAVFATESIDGVTYTLRPLNPELVLRHGSKLTALIAGPAVQQSFNKFEVPDKEQIPGVLLGVIANVLGEALKHLDHPDVQAAILAVVDDACVSYAQPDGSIKEVELKAIWKSHFLGKAGSLVRFLKWAVHAQYGDFFGAMPELLVGGLKERFASLVSSAQATRPASSPST